MSAPVRVGEYLDTFIRCLVRDALREASADYWVRRAADFDKVGTPRCDEIARACLAKSQLVGEEVAFEVDEFLASEVDRASESQYGGAAA